MIYINRLDTLKSYLLLILISIPFIYIITKNKKMGFFIIMFWVFFADWPMQLNIVPTQLTWLPEIILLIYMMILSIEKKLFNNTAITLSIFTFIVIGIISAIVNMRDIISVLLAFRLDLKFIIMFYCLIQFQFTEKFYKFMLKWLYIFLIIQLPVSIYKFFIYGQGEFAIGTYGAWGGTLSTLLPLIGISISASYWLHKKIKLIYFIILVSCCITFSIIAGKKGLIYFGPILMIYILIKAINNINLKRRVYRYLPVFVLIFLMFIPILYTVKAFKPAISNPLYLKDFVNFYDQRYNTHGDPAGRIPSIIATYKFLSNDIIKYLFGYGPGVTLKSYFKKYDTTENHDWPIWIEYGVTELVQKPIEYGYLGLLFYFIIPLIILFVDNENIYRYCDINILQIISFAYSSILFSYFIIGISYCAIMRADVPGFIFWFFAAIIYSLKKQKGVNNKH